MRYILIMLVILTSLTNAQTIETIERGTPLYPGWQNAINTLINSYNMRTGGNLEKQANLLHSDGNFYIYLDSASGNDANSGKTILEPIKTNTRLNELVPSDLGGRTLNIVVGPGTYSGLGCVWENGTVNIIIVDSLEYDLFRRTYPAGQAWGSAAFWDTPNTMQTMLSDILAAGVDTTNFNPFRKQRPITINGDFYLQNFSRLRDAHIHTYYKTGDFNTTSSQKVGRLVFNERSIIECNYLGHFRSHFTYNVNLNPHDMVAGFWINSGHLGGIYAYQDSSRATRNITGFNATPSLFTMYAANFEDLPGGKRIYLKNIRYGVNFYPYAKNYNSTNYAFNSTAWLYENVEYPKAQIALRAGWGGTLVTDTAMVTILDQTTTTHAISRDKGANYLLYTAGSSNLTQDIIGTTKIRGSATIAAGDSIQVTLTGVLPTDYITLTYSGPATPIKALSYAVFLANKLTIYGDSGRTVNYIRIK